MHSGILFLTIVCCTCCYADDVIRSSPHGDCSSYSANAKNVKPVNGTQPVVVQEIRNWQGILLVLAFGGLGVLLALIHRLIRTYIYFDAHLLDTFFDAGGDVSAAMVMCSVVTKWAWTASVTWSVYNVVKFGVVGQFWFSAGLMVQPFLFAIVACEIRIKAPGAKTFLQVIYARFGSPAHVVVMMFALFVSLVTAGLVMYEGSNMLHALILDVRKEVLVAILAVSVALFAVIGGVGGSIYVAYLSVVLTLSLVIVYFAEVFYDPFSRQVAPLGSWKDIYRVIDCYKVQSEAENDGSSAVSFLSKGGMIEGVLIILCGLSSMFVNQSFWQTSVAAKPTQTVWGFILAGLVWFAIPFGISFGLGTAYQVWTVQAGTHPVPMAQAMEGLLPVYISQRLLDRTGDFLMLVLVSALVVTTAAGDVLAVSSIIVYDIYQTYISPFQSTTTMSPPVIDYQSMPQRSKKAVQNEEYLHYDKRCMMLKHVVVIVMSLLLIPLAVALVAIDIESMYIFKILGVVCGCCVLPVCFSVTWHRVTGLGICLGTFAGFLSGMVGWLVYASTYDGGLVNFYVNTRRWEPMLAGTTLSFGVGGLVAVICSLCCGGCDSDRVEEEEWEKTRSIDNQILPWAVKYAPQFKSMKMKGIPHFYAVRRIFKCAEISAYIVGVLLAVLTILVWPACMLLDQDWDQSVYGAWVLVTAIWVGAATLLAVLYPLIAEIVMVCRQCYYNRKWSHRRVPASQRLEEEDASQPERGPQHDARSDKTADSDFHSTIDSGLDDNSGTTQRWQTFIHLSD